MQMYLRRFVECKAQAPNVSDEVVIEAAIKGLRIGPYAQRLARKTLKTVAELYSIME